jgi:small subunit ribosomal protein S17
MSSVSETPVSDTEVNTEVSDTEVSDTGISETETGQSASPEQAAARGNRKTRRGYVVSDKMQKTVVVEVEDRVKHPLYGKVLRRTSKVKAHDEQETAGVGDLVLIMETRPLSATKRWRVVEVLEKAK